MVIEFWTWYFSCSLLRLCHQIRDHIAAKFILIKGNYGTNLESWSILNSGWLTRILACSLLKFRFHSQDVKITQLLNSQAIYENYHSESCQQKVPQWTIQTLVFTDCSSKQRVRVQILYASWFSSQLMIIKINIRSYL